MRSDLLLRLNFCSKSLEDVKFGLFKEDNFVWLKVPHNLIQNTLLFDSMRGGREGAVKVHVPGCIIIT